MTDIVDKIRKLLALSRNGTQHEAALAAARAAELMAKHSIEEAQLRLDGSRTAEPITEQTVQQSKKRVAWKGAIASALADAFGTKMWWHGGSIVMFGRGSALQAVNYMFLYLTNETDRLADEAWERADGDNSRTWKNSFRLGAASAIAARLREQQRQREADWVRQKTQAEAAEPAAREEAAAATDTQPICNALAIIDEVERDEEEVSEAYRKRSKGFSTARTIGAARSHTAYGAGREAGSKVSLGGGRGLKTPSAKLRA